MDTCKIMICQKGADEYLLDRMKKMGERYIKEGNTEKVEAFSRFFHRSQEFVIAGHRLHLEWKPKETCDKNAVIQVTFHLSHHKTFKNWLRWAKLAFGRCLPLVIDGRIVRFDCKIDVLLPYDFVYYNLFQPKGRSEARLRSNRRTLYYGSYPRETRVYEKDIGVDQVDLGTSKDSEETNQSGVRIEIETHGNRRPISTLRQIEKLRDINPFRHLRFLSNDKLVVDDKLPLKTKTLLWAFENRCREVGADRAIKEFNHNGNFKRTIERHYRPLPDNLLHNAWKRGARRYLGPEAVALPSPLKDTSFLTQNLAPIRHDKESRIAKWSMSRLNSNGGSDE